MPISHVSDTARWVAIYRAMETVRADALFRDPWAPELAGERGKEIVRSVPRGRASAWAMIVRTVLFDELIVRVVADHQVDTVLNLGAGLDARPYRLRLPADLRWVDVDFPDVLEYKRSILGKETASCQVEWEPADLTDLPARRALIARIGVESRCVLVVTEGVLLYFTEDEVSALARDFRAQPTFKFWCADLASPLLMQLLTRMWGTSLQGTAEMKFAPADGAAFFEPNGWKLVEFRSLFEEAHRLRREMPLGWLWRLLRRASASRREAYRTMGAVLMLRRA
jgi:methyltransferase (TIGR00027 family)